MIGSFRKEEFSKIYTTFLREKPVEMILFLKNAKGATYSSVLAKNADCTYSHVVKVLKEMEKEGIVVFNKQGRLKLLSLTKKGQELAEMFDRIKKLLSSDSKE
ncbi:MAG TPA: winged helix-turn-helix domain-containing protein [Candidatus Woesearchaeota archaeon]|jgi:predicted transcriptional regulator|nr:winged helix-turn-helix domain-containing protein [Candidatus Woesearchaeota archaeon]